MCLESLSVGEIETTSCGHQFHSKSKTTKLAFSSALPRKREHTFEPWNFIIPFYSLSSIFNTLYPQPNA
jgi:hypothetical protein